MLPGWLFNPGSMSARLQCPPAARGELMRKKDCGLYSQQSWKDLDVFVISLTKKIIEAYNSYQESP
jgi:hypothetical protein